MPEFTFKVTVSTDTEEHALRVMQERIEHSERYFENGAINDAERGDEIEYSIWLWY